MKRHGFHLPGSCLLIGGNYNRVYNCLMKKSPRMLPKMDPEKFRLASEGITGESRGLFLAENGSVAPRKEFYAEILSHDMLWWKIRAFLSTMLRLGFSAMPRAFFFFLRAQATSHSINSSEKITLLESGTYLSVVSTL